ncbi:glycerol-3-phosphate acyltransferase [Chloroflexota bacterium]
MLGFLLVLGGYILGSIPFAYMVGRIYSGVDIRKIGDRNMGAANTYRQIGPIAGWTTFAADIAKGATAVLIAQTFASPNIALLVGFAAVVGHNWPVFVGFRGGRGAATTIGVLLVLLPQAMLILLSICAVPFLVTRNTMLGGAILFSPLWLVALLLGASGVFVGYSIALPCLVGATHFMKTRHLPEDIKRGAVYMR